MGKKLLNLEHEIELGQENAKNTKELYQLLSSYNAYSILLLKAKSEYERKTANIKRNYSDSDCYKNQIEDLFFLFNSDECLRAKQLSGISNKDMLFLIDQDTILRMNSYDIMHPNIGGLSNIDYELLKINYCVGKVHTKSVYCGDPYYCDRHWENKEAFGLFYKGNLITPSYELDSQFRLYDNMDIREILKPQSLDEIYEKITEAKDTKAKKLVLTKY